MLFELKKKFGLIDTMEEKINIIKDIVHNKPDL